MRTKNKNITDLEYLAELGFEGTAVSELDITGLNSKIRSRVLSYNTGNHFAFISLLMGIFIGISVFFSLYTQPLSHIPFTNSGAARQPQKENLATLSLDTVNVVPENFVKHKTIQPKINEPLTVTTENNRIDSAVSMNSVPIDPTGLNPEKIKEPGIKYISNSPIIFIHDLKLTDYSLLYFKRNKFVNLNVKEGLAAAYANKEDLKKYGNVLEPEDNYYLHQAIADALKEFKNKNYNACLNKLNTVMQFNHNDINCRFYYGMCYFYKKSYWAAIKDLDECIANPNNAFLQEAEYYKAVSLYEYGKKPEALKLFKKIAEDEGFYADKAKKYL